MNELPDTIFNRNKFLKTLPPSFDGVYDWSWTKGCFGKTKITPTDLDAIIERNGNFLVFETKTPGILVPQGQMILLNRLVDTRFFTIMIIWGKKYPEKFLTMFPNGGEREYFGIEEAKKIVKYWFNYADRQKRTKD